MTSYNQPVSESSSGPRAVLVIDYHNVSTMWSGHSLLAQLDHMDAMRYKAVVVFNRPCDMEREVAQRGIETVVIPYGGGSVLKRGWQYGRLPLSLWALARRVKPALIHANNALAARPAMALKALTGLPVVVQLRNIDLPPRTATMVLKADHFAAVSGAVAKATLPSYTQPHTTVVFDGLELSDYVPGGPAAQANARRQLGLPTDRLIVGMAGRLSEQKGHRDYVKVAEEITRNNNSDVLFVHAGKIPDSEAADPYERELAGTTAEMCACNKFCWLGYIRNVAQFWEAVDIAVVPSCGPEAFGRVIIEAMAMGKPVVTTLAGGPQEVIDAPTSGLLIPMADSVALAGAIERLLSSPDERRRMGNAARARVEREFSATAYAQKMMDLYDKVLRPI